MTGADFDNPTNQDGFRIIYHKEVDNTVTSEEIEAKVILHGTSDLLSLKVRKQE